MPKLVALAFKSQSTAETANALASHPIALHASTCDLSKDGGEFINVTYWMRSSSRVLNQKQNMLFVRFSCGMQP